MANPVKLANHMLSICLEMEFTSFLKTSDLINSCIMKSLRIFFLSLCFIFFILWSLEFFASLKTWFLNLYQVKVIRYQRFKMLYCNREHYWTISASCCGKNLEMIKKNILSWLVKKINKNLAKKSISVFGGLPLTPLNTQQLIFSQMFY